MEEQNSDDKIMLEAINECVYGSTVRHVLHFPYKVIVKYLSIYPFYRGADTLYYLLLKREGKKVYYDERGIHLVSIQPELSNVYNLAEQDCEALEKENVPGKTIYEIIMRNIGRMVVCKHYQQRNKIMTEEETDENAAQIPSIALNFPKYQMLLGGMTHVTQVMSIIICDCWEAIKYMDSHLCILQLERMTYVKVTMPNLWHIVLEEYYRKEMVRLGINNVLHTLPVRHIRGLNSIYPDIIKYPDNLDTIGVRIWYSPEKARAYLLGFKVEKEMPTLEEIKENINKLQEWGIEKFVEEITKIEINSEGKLTGRIGQTLYPLIKDKVLVNSKDLQRININIYYPADLYMLISDKHVVVITRNDIINMTTRNSLNYHGFRDIFLKGGIPYLIEIPTEQIMMDMFSWVTIDIGIVRSIPARIKLVEMMSIDTLL